MDETLKLIELAHQGDKAARDRLVTDNMGLIWSIVKRFAGRGYEQEDLFQIGSIGLIKAIDKFDLNYQVRFSTYAVPMISGEIRRFLRDDGMIKVSRSLKELAGKVFLVKEELSDCYGRDPTVEEIAGKLGRFPGGRRPGGVYLQAFKRHRRRKRCFNGQVRRKK